MREYDTIYKNGVPTKIRFNRGTINKKITEGTFNAEPYVETIIINDGIEEIGDRAFAGYEGLREVHFPNTLKKIGNKAFLNCDSLKNISLPEGCETIGSMSFAFDYDLETVIIPSSMNRIEPDTFYRCVNLKYFILLNPKLDINKIKLPVGCKIIRGIEEKR